MKLYIKRSQEVHNSDLALEAFEFSKEYEKMINSNMSLEDFKGKYLDFKERYDKFIEKLEAEEKAKGITAYSIDLASGQSLVDKNVKTKQEQVNKTFKPIKGESQNKETYQNKDANELLKKLLENKFNLSKELEILFGVKIDDKDVNNNDFTKIFSNANLHNIKSVDLKA